MPKFGGGKGVLPAVPTTICNLQDFTSLFCVILKTGVRRVGQPLTSAANRNRGKSRVAGALFLCSLIGLILSSVPAAADVTYPISGVFAAINPEFPNATIEICTAVKIFGVEAVSEKSISELITFAKDKRYDVKGDVQTETTIRSINATDGAFRITETFNKSRGWIGIRRKAEYDLKIVDPQTIEIWDGKNLTRYAKCGRVLKQPI
jgi:hypothetical protein